MPVVSPMNQAACALDSSLRDLGPCLINLSEYCTTGSVPDIFFRAGDQRGELTLAIGQQFLDNPTQATAISIKREQGQTIQLNLALGSRILVPQSLAVALGHDVGTDAVNTDQDSVGALDSPGRSSKHYQVVIIPYKSGEALDFSFGFVIDYAIATTENMTLTFSPNTPIEGQFSFVGEPHPVTSRRGYFLKSKTNAPLAQLRSAVSDYLNAYPDSPEWLEMQVVTTAPNQTYSWQITAGDTINATTQWGDGTSSTHNAIGIYTKTYASAGTYRVRIRASFGSGGAFNLRPNADRTRLNAFFGPIPTFQGLASLMNLINGCTGLTSLPSDFLWHNTSVTTMQGMMSGCTGLTSLPADFLRYNTSVTTMQNMMGGCTRLSLRSDLFGPSIVDRFLNQSVSFATAFQNVGTFAGTPQGTAPAVWTANFGSGTPIRTNAFSGGSPTTLSNWAQIPIAWGGPA